MTPLLTDSGYVLTGNLMIVFGGVFIVSLIVCVVTALQDNPLWKTAAGVAAASFVVFTVVCWTVASQA